VGKSYLADNQLQIKVEQLFISCSDKTVFCFHDHCDVVMGNTCTKRWCFNNFGI